MHVAALPLTNAIAPITREVLRLLFGLQLLKLGARCQYGDSDRGGNQEY
jgi:hypothetical protein